MQCRTKVGKQLKKQEMDCNALKTRIDTIKNKLYNGMVGNPKELQHLQQKIELMNKDLDSDEEVLLTLVVEKEEQEKLRQQQQAEWEKAQKEFEKCRRSYSLWKKGLQQELEQLTGEQEQLQEKIDGELIKTYNRMQERFGCRVLAKIEGGVCTGCNVRIPTSLRKEIKAAQKLTRCESCGRILFIEQEGQL
jgi:hypothetical protein